MKKFNLFNEIIVADRAALMRAINAGKEFGITIEGDVVAMPLPERRLLIYHGRMTPPKPSPLKPQSAAPSLAELFGANYRIVEDEERVLIKAGAAWQEIIGFNLPVCDYDDTTADGISDFPDETLEAIGWHATEFGIDYRTIVEFLEAECEGVLLCIEQEEPYQFSGMGYFADIEHARDLAFGFCKTRIAALMAEDSDYAPENLTDDEQDAVEYFGLA